MPTIIPEIPDDEIVNTDTEPHTVGEILAHISHMREYLISGLVEMGFELIPKWDSYGKVAYRKWSNTDTKRNLWLTVEIVAMPTYVNTWVDKLWDGERMGNGFYHKSIDWWDDLYQFLHLVSLAR